MAKLFTPKPSTPPAPPAPSTTEKIAELQVKRRDLIALIVALETKGARRERRPAVADRQNLARVLLGEAEASASAPAATADDELCDAYDERAAADLALQILGERQAAERAEVRAASVLARQ